MSPCIINHYVLIINHYVGARRWWPRSASRAAHLLAKKPSRRQWILLQQLRRTMLRRMLRMTRTHSVLPKACSTTAQSKSRAARTAQWAWSLRAPSSTGTEVASHLCPQLGRGTHLKCRSRRIQRRMLHTRALAQGEFRAASFTRRCFELPRAARAQEFALLVRRAAGERAGLVGTHRRRVWIACGGAA